MKTEFCTDTFESSHGRTPRGRGSWAFAFDRYCTDLFWVPGAVLYTEAKKKAKKLAAAELAKRPNALRPSHVTLHVCP